jgi:hypothetical protein
MVVVFSTSSFAFFVNLSGLLFFPTNVHYIFVACVCKPSFAASLYCRFFQERHVPTIVISVLRPSYVTRGANAKKAARRGLSEEHVLANLKACEQTVQSFMVGTYRFSYLLMLSFGLLAFSKFPSFHFSPSWLVLLSHTTHTLTQNAMLKMLAKVPKVPPKYPRSHAQMLAKVPKMPPKYPKICIRLSLLLDRARYARARRAGARRRRGGAPSAR